MTLNPAAPETAPREYLDLVVRPNIEELRANPGSLRHAHNAVLTADALAAHVFLQLMQIRPAVIPEYSNHDDGCLATECRPDLAIVDVNLQGEMAYELMDWLHARGIRVVVISGYGDLPSSLAKFAAILHKPSTMATLLTTVQRVAPICAGMDVGVSPLPVGR